MIVSFHSKIRIRSNNEKPGSRYFCNTPKDISTQLKAYASTQPKKRGRGSLKVKVRIGFYTRTTSIFPDSTSESYLLPIKAEVRKELHIGDGDELHIELEVLSL